MNPGRELDHAILLSNDLALKLGRAHCLIVEADEALHDKMFEKEKGNGFFEGKRLTPFGEAVKDNFIRWWLCQNIGEIGKVNDKLTGVQASLTRLKRASKDFAENCRANNYGRLIADMAEFANTHTRDIETFSTFVQWLREIDDLAPCMFFQFPLWSASQKSDRDLRVSACPPTDNEIRRATEIVFGLRIRHEPTYTSTEKELQCEIADSWNPERGAPPCPPPDAVFVRACRKALEEFMLYFEKIRVCAQAVESELHTLSREEILQNHEFLQMFLRKAIDTSRTEPVLWDFKETVSAWHAKEEKPKIEFAEIVASFANTEGGLIIIGITNGRSVVGITDPETRKVQTRKLLQRYLGTCSQSVKMINIPFPVNEAGRKNLLLILIPQTKDVVGVRNVEGGFFYPIRLESGTQRSSREEIAEKKKRDVCEDNFHFAARLFDFVFRDILVG